MHIHAYGNNKGLIVEYEYTRDTQCIAHYMRQAESYARTSLWQIQETTQRICIYT